MWLFSALFLLLTPSCSTAQDEVTGPRTVRGQEQGSLTVQCHYQSRWRTYKKFSCRGANWSSCKILIRTDGTEKLVKKDHLSIRDNQTTFMFMVTMEDLRKSDADIYWCGIDKAGADHRFKVNVIIDPAPEKLTILPRTTATGLTSTKSTTETNSNQRVNQTGPLTRSPLSNIYFWFLVFLELPLLLSMLSAVLWVNRPQRWSGGR